MPTQIGKDTNWAEISAGILFSLALKRDGGLWAWGANWAGQLADEADRQLVSFADGYKPDGPSPKVSVPTCVDNESDWKAIASGGEHVLALKRDNSLWSWGQNDSGQLGDGTFTHRNKPVRVGSANDWAAIAAGGGFTSGHSVGLKQDGSLWVWDNWRGDLNTNRLADPVLREKISRPVRLGNDSDWVRIAGGQGYTLALKADGTMWAVGRDASAQFSPTPGSVQALRRVSTSVRPTG